MILDYVTWVYLIEMLLFSAIFRCAFDCFDNQIYQCTQSLKKRT